MQRTHLLRWAVIAVTVGLMSRDGPTRADVESELLQKFQKQNQAADRKLVIEVENALAQASSSDLEQARQLLFAAKGLLQGDASLSREQRESLFRRVDMHLRLVQNGLEEKRKQEAAAAAVAAAEEAKAKKNRLEVKPSFFSPIITPVPSGGKFEASPVVSPDRMWVRIRLSGNFTIPQLGPPVPIPLLAPNLLQGPGRGNTLVPPIGVAQKNVFLPNPVLSTFGVNSTALVPDGGTAVVGGFTTLSESRSESGPPGLSNISNLNRMFKNAAYGSESRITRSNVSVKVFRMEELEPRD